MLVGQQGEVRPPMLSRVVRFVGHPWRIPPWWILLWWILLSENPLGGYSPGGSSSGRKGVGAAQTQRPTKRHRSPSRYPAFRQRLAAVEEQLSSVVPTLGRKHRGRSDAAKMGQMGSI